MMFSCLYVPSIAQQHDTMLRMNLARILPGPPCLQQDRTLAMSVKQCMSELKQDFTETRRDILAIQTDLAAHKTDSDRDRIIQWLSTSSDPSFNHEKACQKHEPATGEWMFRSTEYKQWRTTRNSLLWLHGIRK